MFGVIWPLAEFAALVAVEFITFVAGFVAFPVAGALEAVPAAAAAAAAAACCPRCCEAAALWLRHRRSSKIKIRLRRSIR